MKMVLKLVFRYLQWVVSGVLLAMSFPPNGVPFLGFIALIPSIYRSYRDGYFSVILGSLIFSLVLYSLTLDWFSSFHPLAPLGVMIPLCLYNILPFVAFSVISKGMREDVLLLFPFLWVGVEILRGNGFWSLPLLYLAHTQYHFALVESEVFSAINGAVPSLAQVFGVFGVSFFVALFNSLILVLAMKIVSKKLELNLVYLVSVVLLSFLGFFLVWLSLSVLKEFSIAKVVVWLALVAVIFLVFMWNLTKEVLVKVIKMYYSIVVVIVVVFTGLGLFLEAKLIYEASNANSVRFSLLQPNFSPWEKLFAKDFDKLNIVVRLYHDASKDSDLVVGCESILRDPVNMYWEFGDWFGVKAMGIAKEVGKPIILTYPHMERFLTNTFIVRDGKLHRVIQEMYRYYNSALFFDKKGVSIARYDKVHTVPFGEWTPFSEYIPPLRQAINAIVGGDLTPGKRFMVISVEVKPNVVVNMAPIICFEDLYPYIAKKLRRMGADVLVNMTNDGWANSVKSQWQHLIGAMYRAIEVGLPLLRATNTGRSAVVLPYGRIISRIDDFKQGFMAETVKLKKIDTLFVSYGEHVFLGIVVLGSLLAFFCPFIRYKIRY
ncbi:MAG: apolipoprotein N-acyltransferase [Brevinematia bacterium]